MIIANTLLGLCQHYDRFYLPKTQFNAQGHKIKDMKSIPRRGNNTMHNNNPVVLFSHYPRQKNNQNRAEETRLKGYMGVQYYSTLPVTTTICILFHAYNIVWNWEKVYTKRCVEE